MLSAGVLPKFFPLIITVLPTGPAFGANESIVGIGGEKVKPGYLPSLMPMAIVTLPLAPLPTIAVITESDSTTKLAAATPPKLTALAPVNLSPFIVMNVPALAVIGTTEVINGVCT